ncbi:sucrose-6-phosphate hydrolase [Enterococcus faecium]|uniref:Sucrose-6-phosphate hydrolase n=9 Tax=Enterococcus TaxID=1350 RepID=A0A367CBS0_9ENTE|nr:MULTISPECIES: sucrose-6-phosphate hydrolase [Enterococcus]EGO5824445.1 sucrose-6-phosphate hydrolase [Enterococcus faecalis]EGO9940219.1 sucrose-6-phosphate hydrolase [Enterococcus faecium]EGP4729555.1 sucrose-6-phosphate hydrolase [Enterococcus faecium]EGP4996597.1 sucrose-6-phosphate hydrolase [Enterococcus faecium]EGP5052913.1 sucrose-6-phosphate hydrolase [Enterococcus faecium]
MNLPQETRYRAYSDWSKEEIAKINENVNQSPWHASYHIEPRTGLLNDPNGFSFFNGKYNLFYQNWPFGAAHGLKEWIHTESDDLVHFYVTGAELRPDTEHDSHGAYSGSAYEVDGKLFLFYTGNVRDKKWIRDTLQIGAWMDKDHNITKCENILIHKPADVTEHFRDPQIFNYKGQLYTIVGAQNLEKSGFIKVYKATDNNVETWEEVGNLDFGSTGSEYMIECPNLLFVDEKPVIIYCPQGLDKSELNYDNIYPNTFKICQSFDTENIKLVGASEIQNLDYGFEAYATQGFNTPDGRTLIVSWIGLPDIDYPTDKYNYQGAMSLVKELSIKDGKLYQYPVEAITSLRASSEQFTAKAETNNTYELELTFPPNQKSELLLFSDSKGNGLSLIVDTKEGKIILDRSKAGIQYATDFGTIRECSIDTKETTANIFVDNSIIEIFINKGEKVFTSRVFPENHQNGIQIKSGEPTGKYFELKYQNGSKIN